MARYKCKDCGAKFPLHDITTYCPECQGNKFIKELSASQLFFIRYGKLGIIAVVILLAIIIITKWNGKNGNSKPMAYELGFQPLDDGVEIFFYERDVGSNLPRQRISNANHIANLTVLFNLRVFDSRENQLQIINGRFYPCYTPDTLHISWRNNETYPLSKPLYLSENIAWELKASALNPLACRISLEITEVKILSQCKLEVQTNYDDTNEMNDVLISITGKNGPYINQRVWDAREKEQYDVWAVLQGDTVDFVTLNGTSFQGIDCNIVPPNLDELILLGNLYGSNPANVSHYDNFFNAAGINASTVYFLDNNIIDRAMLENRMRIQYQNDNTTFRIAPNGIVISENNVVQVKYITQKDA